MKKFVLLAGCALASAALVAEPHKAAKNPAVAQHHVQGRPQHQSKPVSKPQQPKPASHPKQHVVSHPVGKPQGHHQPQPPHHAAAPLHHGGPAVGHNKHVRPHGARFWARPPAPPPRRHGALRAWQWVATAWDMTIDGVYCYGDGYYFDGYNYYYNGAYYTTPPVVVTQPVVSQPVVVTQPVATQPVVVTQPVVTQPVVVTPPPRPRRRGLLQLLLGD